MDVAAGSEPLWNPANASVAALRWRRVGGAVGGGGGGGEEAEGGGLDVE